MGFSLQFFYHIFFTANKSLTTFALITFAFLSKKRKTTLALITAPKSVKMSVLYQKRQKYRKRETEN